MSRFKFFTQNKISLPWYNGDLYQPDILPIDYRGPQHPAIDPVHNNRFVVYFPEEFGINPNWVTSVSNLNCTINSNEIGLNIVSWEPLLITFHDIITQSISQLLLGISQNFEQYTHFELRILKINSFGDVIENIIVNVAGISAMNFGGYSYDSDELNKIEMELTINSISII